MAKFAFKRVKKKKEEKWELLRLVAIITGVVISTMVIVGVKKNSYLNDKKSAILHLYCCTDILLH